MCLDLKRSAKTGADYPPGNRRQAMGHTDTLHTKRLTTATSCKLAIVTVLALGGVLARVWRSRWAPLLLCLGPLAGMCVPAGGVVGMECGRGARDTVLSTPYASPRQLVLIFLPGQAPVHHTCTYVVHAAQWSGLAASPHGRASPWRGGACKTKTRVVGVPTQGGQSGQLVVSY